jgi:hypothetical protein
MSRPTLDHDYEQIQAHWLEHNGAPAHHNLYLKICLLFCLILIGFLIWLNHKEHQKTIELAQHPIAFRISEIGRVEPIRSSSLEYTPQVDEIRYYLSRAYREHFSRMKATIATDYLDSLNFFSRQLAQPLIEEETKTHWIEKFATKGEEENDVQVESISLTDTRTQPFHAEIVYLKIFHNDSLAETRRERWISHCTFTVSPLHNNQLVLSNPLGLVIDYHHEDEAFTN